MTKFAAALAQYKRKHRLNNIELAERMDADQYSVCRWLKGVRTPTVERISATAKSLRIPIGNLL